LKAIDWSLNRKSKYVDVFQFTGPSYPHYLIGGVIRSKEHIRVNVTVVNIATYCNPGRKFRDIVRTRTHKCDNPVIQIQELIEGAGEQADTGQNVTSYRFLGSSIFPKAAGLYKFAKKHSHAGWIIEFLSHSLQASGKMAKQVVAPLHHVCPNSEVS
jgi:hypothetical protein